MPSSLKLLKKVNVSRYPDSVAHHQGFTYVGLENGTVERIADLSLTTGNFVRTNFPENNVVIHEDFLYVL